MESSNDTLTRYYNKKKKRKHIQPIKRGLNEEITHKLTDAKPINNEELKFAIKQRKQEVANV